MAIPAIISVDGASFTASEIEEARQNGSTATKLQTVLLTVDSDNFDDASLDATKWDTTTVGAATVVETTVLTITGGAGNYDSGLRSKYAWTPKLYDKMSWTFQWTANGPDFIALMHTSNTININLGSGTEVGTGYHYQRDTGAYILTGQAPVENVTYTFTAECVKVLASGRPVLTWKINGGVFTDYVVFTTGGNISVPRYLWFTVSAGGVMVLDDWSIKSQFTTGGVVATLADTDSGATDSVWDISTFDMFENPDGETGTITYSYAYGNSANPSNWSAYLTKANMLLESDPTGRYFKVRAKLTSATGAEKVALSEGSISCSVASTATPAIDIDTSLQKAGVRTVNYTVGDTVQVTGSVESSVTTTGVTVAILIKRLSDDATIATLFSNTTDLTAATPKTFTDINGSLLTWTATPATDYYLSVQVSGGTPAIGITVNNEDGFHVAAAADTTPPGKATSPAATDPATNGDLTLTWNRSPDDGIGANDTDYYGIAVSAISAAACAALANAATFSVAKVATGAASYSLTVGGLTNDIPAYLIVAPIDDSGNYRTDYVAGDAATATPTGAGETTPPSHALLVATDAGTGGRVNFTITPPTDADYSNTKIYRRGADGAFTVLAATITAPATTGNVTGLNNNAFYGFVAIAYDTSGNPAKPSNHVVILVTDGTGLEFLTELAAYLETNTIGTVGTNIFKDFQPDSPDACVVVIDDGGGATNPHDFIRSETITFLVRNTTYTLAEAKIQAIYALFEAKTNISLTHWKILTVRQGAQPAGLGMDERRRFEMSVTYEFRIHRKG